MSLAAWMPSSFRFFSICLERAREALSSADMAHPILLTRRAATFEAQAVATPATHTHTLTRTHTRTSACGGMGNETWARADEWGEGGGKLCSDLYQAHTSLRNKSFIVPFPPCRIARSASGYHHHILSEFHSQSGLKQVPHDTELWLFSRSRSTFIPSPPTKINLSAASCQSELADFASRRLLCLRCFLFPMLQREEFFGNFERAFSELGNDWLWPNFGTCLSAFSYNCIKTDFANLMNCQIALLFDTASKGAKLLHLQVRKHLRCQIINGGLQTYLSKRHLFSLIIHFSNV